MNKSVLFQSALCFSLMAFFSMSCKKNEDAAVSPAVPTNISLAPKVYYKIYGATNLYVEGGYVVIKCTGLPDHRSPYYLNTEWAFMYQPYNGSGTFNQNPNKIGIHDYTFRIPLNPRQANVHQATPLGAMGVSINGIPFYNQYAGPNNQALTSEIYSFDQYAGHPDQGSAYHYHVEPTYLTQKKGSSALLGFLLDGFPVYGPVEDGLTVDNTALDEFHGHIGVTEDYPDGIYHYHVTSSTPYINGSGFYGTPGTVTH